MAGIGAANQRSCDTGGGDCDAGVPGPATLAPRHGGGRAAPVQKVGPMIRSGSQVAIAGKKQRMTIATTMHST